MAANWQTVPVFISSTFKDMQAERDHLVRFVFPRLRRELLKRQIHFVDVDLRWGVTSEQDALEVCREIIDECRPRFLCMLGGRYGWTPSGQDRSITADEVHYAALAQPKDGYEHFFYFRKPADTQKIVENEAGEYREPDGSENAKKLEQLKQSVIDAGYAPHIYPARWNDKQNRLVDLDAFGDRVYQDLLTSIVNDKKLNAKSTETLGEFAQENAAIEAFIAERVERYIAGSRQTVLDDLADFAKANDTPNVLVLTGTPGSGKSALLGQCYRNVTKTNDETQLVIPHFVGASTGSTDVRRTLRRLCHELARAAGVTEELPHDVRELTELFSSLLGQVAESKRIVLIVDALNQMDAADSAHVLHWLPREFPENVRVIVSSLEHPALDALRQRGKSVREETLQPLNADDAKAIVQSVLNRYRKRLDPMQMNLLLAKAEAVTPLYLLVALEELRTLGDYDAITAWIEKLPGTTQELFLWILKERLSHDPGFRNAEGNLIGVDLVRKFVSSLGVSRHGLSESELAGLIAPGNLDTDPSVPDDSLGNVAALQALLQPYLMQRGELLDFYHGQFREAVDAEYLDEEQERREAHRQLAEFFHRQLNPTDEEPWSGHSARAISELPYHQTNGECWDELETTLTTLRFLEAKNQAGKVFELAGDFTAAVDALPIDRPQRRILRLLDEALRRDLHFIARHAEDYPQGLFQCLWNSAWWYDCPETANHYEPPERGWPTNNNAPPWARSDSEKLCLLLEGWREEKESAVPNSFWLRSLRPPATPLDSPLLAVLRGHERAVTSVSCSLDGRFLVSASDDSTVRVWGMSDGALLRVRDAGSEGKTVAISRDGMRIVSASRDGTARLWDLATGSQLCVMRGHESYVNSAGFSPDGGRIVSGSDDRTVRVWDAETGVELTTFHGHTAPVTSVAFSPDGTRVVSGSEDKTVRLWEFGDKCDPDVLCGHEMEVLCVAFSSNGNWIASSSIDDTVRMWDGKTCATQTVLRGHLGPVVSVAFSPDDNRIATGSWDDTIRVWDAITGDELRQLLGHSSTVSSVAYSPDGRRLISGSEDGTIRVWDADRDAATPTLRGAEESVEGHSFSPDGRWFVTSTQDGRIRFWDSISALPGHCLSGHGKPVTFVAFSFDSRRAVTVSNDDGIVCVWDLVRGTRQLRLNGQTNLDRVAFSPNGKHVIVGNRAVGHVVQIWDSETGALRHRIPSLSFGLRSIAYSYDGSRLVAILSDPSVQLIEDATGAPLWRVPLDTLFAYCVAYSPDGRHIATGTGQFSSIGIPIPSESPAARFKCTPQGYVLLWDIDRRTVCVHLPARRKNVVALAFSEDGRKLISESSDIEFGGVADLRSGNNNAIQVWDLETWMCEDEFSRDDVPAWAELQTHFTVRETESLLLDNATNDVIASFATRILQPRCSTVGHVWWASQDKRPGKRASLGELLKLRDEYWPGGWVGGSSNPNVGYCHWIKVEGDIPSQRKDLTPRRGEVRPSGTSDATNPVRLLGALEPFSPIRIPSVRKPRTAALLGLFPRGGLAGSDRSRRLIVRASVVLTILWVIATLLAAFSGRGLPPEEQPSLVWCAVGLHPYSKSLIPIQLVTYFLIHLRGSDLILSSLILWYLVSIARECVSFTGFLGVYLTGAISGALVYLLTSTMTGSPQPMVGSGPALMSMLGALAVYQPKRKVYAFFLFSLQLRQVAFAILLGLLAQVPTAPQINLSAIAGLVAGALYAFVEGTRINAPRPGPGMPL